MSNIEIKNAGAAVANIQLESEGKPMQALYDAVKSKVKTAEDLSDFLDGYAAALKGAGKSEGSVRTMKSRANRIGKIMTNTDPKLAEFHGINSPAEGAKLVKSLMGEHIGITDIYEALAPKAPEVEEPEVETAEPTEAEAEPLAKIMADAIVRAHEHGYTNEEIKEWANASL